MKSLNPFITTIKNTFATTKTTLKQFLGRSEASFEPDPNEVATVLVNTSDSQLKHSHTPRTKTNVKKIRFNYSTELIPQLLGGHQEILRQMSLVDNDAYEKNTRAAFENLQILIHLLHAQLQLEKSRLYPYLQKTLTDNIDAYTTMRNLRKKTDHLMHQIAIMEKKYNQMRNNPALIDQLEGDNTTLSMLLVENFREVETLLYPLYQPGN